MISFKMRGSIFLYDNLFLFYEFYMVNRTLIIPGIYDFRYRKNRGSGWIAHRVDFYSELTRCYSNTSNCSLMPEARAPCQRGR